MQPNNLSREINEKEVAKLAIFDLSEIYCPK